MKKSDIELDEFQTYLCEKGNREKTIEDYEDISPIFKSGYN
jgi:hypothetical protein